jgi:GNAT superfamily N-acetyltransferase
VHGILERAGFAPGPRTEIVFLAAVDGLARPAAPATGLTVARTLGINGTRLMALLDGRALGYLEVGSRLIEGGRIVRQVGWADIGNLEVQEPHRRRGIATWLLGQAAEWLLLGRTDRLLGYTGADEEKACAFLRRAGFRELTRTRLGWEQPTSAA